MCPSVEEAPIEFSLGALALPLVELLQDLIYQHIRVVVAFQQIVKVVMLVDGFQSVENLIIIIITLLRMIGN